MVKKLLLLFSICSTAMYAQTYTMSNTPLNTCSGTHLDPGGLGNYVDNSSFSQTICSTMGNCVSITFSSFALENGFDNLFVYDGPGTSSPQIAGSPFTGNVNPGTLTCTSGCMTLVFSSDVSITDAGWSATISCVTCPPPPPPPDNSYAWSQRTSVPAIGRHRGTACAVAMRGYVGMGHINAITDIIYDDWWEYDPSSNSWTQKASFPPGPRMHPTSFSIGNYAYVGTGRDAAYVERNDLWRYDPGTNSWAPMASMPSAGRRGAVAFSVGGMGYIGTGTYTSDFWKYNPITNSWSGIPPYPGGGRISSVAFAIGDKGYVGTGDNGGPTGDFYEYDPATNMWTPKAMLTGLPRMEAAAFELNGKGYIGTGCDYQSGNNYQDFWCYDPSSNTWGQVVDFSGVARRYMNAFTIGSRAYACFGTSGTNYNDLWEYGNFSSVEEHTQTVEVKTFPNPFSDRITFSIPGNVSIENATLVLYDISGKMVREVKAISEREFILKKEDLQNGIYFYELLLNPTTRATGKFIAQ